MTDNKALAESIRNYLESGVDLLLTDDDYRTIIKALEQEPCENCISREQAIKQCGFGMTSLLIADNLRRLPPVTPKPKTGHWIVDGGLYRCSNCNHLFSELWWVSSCPIDRMNKIMRFCPNCGAKMESEDKE